MAISRRTWLIIGLLLMSALVLACGTSNSVQPSATAPRSPTYTPKPTFTVEPTATEVEVVMTIKSNVNCRKGPSTNYAVVTVLDAGAVVRALGRAEDNGWWHVQNPADPSSGCWIRQDFAEVQGDVYALPVFTAMPAPKVAEPTAAPDCKVDATIRINNQTGGYITIYLTGPASFTFNVPDGQQTISVCSGTYSYTAYGCGGASKNGTVGPGDEIKFWCQ